MNRRTLYQNPLDNNILALDLGTTTGFAYSAFRDFEGRPNIKHGSIGFRGSRFEGGGARFLKFGNWLRTTPVFQAIHVCYFEEVRRHSSTDAAHVYGGFLAVLTAFMEERQIPYIGVPVGTIKKHATGRGNANKALMIKAANDLGHEINDDNEADAIALLYYAYSRTSLIA